MESHNKPSNSDLNRVKNLQMSEAANRIFFYYGLSKPELVDRLVDEKNLKNTVLKISDPSKYPEKFYFIMYPGIFNISVFASQSLIFTVNFGDPSFDKIKNLILSKNGKAVY